MRNRSLKRKSEPTVAPVEHYARLADEFGSPRRGRYTAVDEGRPMTGSRFWLQPLTLFILSLLALLLVSSAQLWRLGWFGVWFGAKSAQVDRSSKRWQLDGRKSAPASPMITASEEREVDGGPPADDEEDVVPVTD
jgi:hypothetical protein